MSPGVIIGGMLNITSATRGDDDNSTFGFGPFVGYYVGADKTEIKGGVFPFIKAFFMYSTLSDNDDDATNTAYGVMGGIDYMLSTSVALQAGLQFSSESYSPDGADGSISGTTLMLGVGIEAFVF